LDAGKIESIVIPNRKHKLISTIYFHITFIPYAFDDLAKYKEINWNDYKLIVGNKKYEIR
jgi:hypothetical protein